MGIRPVLKTWTGQLPRPGWGLSGAGCCGGCAVQEVLVPDTRLCQPQGRLLGAVIGYQRGHAEINNCTAEQAAGAALKSG